MSQGDRQAGVAGRERLIESHLPLVRAIARRYAGRGEALDDLVQVGSIGLIRASDRFEPDRGVAFATFATPAIEGEIRRHLGERTTSLRIPRELQRMSGQLQRCRAQLGASLGRDPTVEELATALGVAREDVERALVAERARETLADPPEVEEMAGEYEFRATTDDRLLLALAARALNERERRIVFLRFHADMTERDIAGELGLSQAQVSRSLATALEKLREELDDEHPTPETSRQRGGETPRRAGADTKIAGVGARHEDAGRVGTDVTGPEPERAGNRSGRFLVRMPSDLHEELTVAAEREQVSLNRYVTDALAASLEPGSPTGDRVVRQDPARSSDGSRRASFRVLLAANVVVIVIAAAAAIALVILALERGI